jgi:MFS family permease
VEDLRGRYNGLSHLSWTIGFSIAPVLAGLTLGVGLGPALFVVLIAVLCTIAGAMRVLERHLPPP